MKIAIVIGTRPEIIKMAPVIKELEREEVDFFIIHTGQHYSYNLDRVFFEQLELPQSKFNLEVGSGSQAEQTAKILLGVENVLQQNCPDVVLVEGDTNSVLAGALAASKLHIKVGHVEAGLRSYDKQMPEEINRILTDHCSSYLFAPTEKAKQILLSENISKGNVFVTGNTIVDTIYQNLELSKDKRNFLDTLGICPKEYLLVTAHRQENVDNPTRFASIIDGLSKIATNFHLPVIFPIHPRSRKMLNEFGIEPKNLILIEPVDFLSFLQLESNAKLILTDSGGVQEEACILGVPCVTLRNTTERPESIDVGANILAGVSSDKILECTELMLGNRGNWTNPFGDGKAAEKIAKIIMDGEHG
jgi:UDP-N-acetylglucosamine 2-epimerase (non-hydrolysing)